MSTITLYASKINQMPSLINDAKKSVREYKSDLKSLKTKVLTIDNSVCNVDDVIDSIKSSTQTQGDKIDALDKLKKDVNEFVSDVVRIDGDAADAINKSKDDFYDEYYYLKPECEKSGWEKFKDGCKKIGEWCKEHWVMVVTILVVIAIAIVAVVTFGVAVVAVAAIAGIVSLVLCVADVICMIATGGKDLATIFREKGWNVLADIFQGLSIGCDIVSIVFPAGAAIKSMAKVGIKTFTKTSIKAVKVAFKETIEALGKNGFKKGFLTGMKQLGKITFKTFIFDIDDFTKMKNGKRVFDIMDNSLDPLKTNNHWIKDGNSLVPEPNYTPKPGQNNYRNVKGQTLDKILNDYGYKSIPLTKSGDVDWKALSVVDPVKTNMKNLDVDLDKFLSGNMNSKEKKNFDEILRSINFKNAEAGLPNGKTKSVLEEELGYMLTIHEDISTKKCYFVPAEIHANINHNGGIANYKFNIQGIADKLGDLFGKSGFGMPRLVYDISKG